MELTKEQSFEIMAHNEQRNYFKRKFKYSSKTREICLGCAKPIYISFKHISVNNVFCEKCKFKFMDRRTIVQYRYMNYIKNRQTKITQRLLNADNPNFTKEIVRPILVTNETITKHNIEPISRLTQNKDDDMNLLISSSLESALNDFAL